MYSILQVVRKFSFSFSLIIRLSNTITLIQLRNVAMAGCHGRRQTVAKVIDGRMPFVRRKMIHA